MLQIVNTINSYLSDYILVFLLVAVGLWYTVKTKCVQRYLWKGLKQLFGGFSLRGGSQGGGMSSFQAVATAIAAQVGTTYYHSQHRRIFEHPSYQLPSISLLSSGYNIRPGLSHIIRLFFSRFTSSPNQKQRFH